MSAPKLRFKEFGGDWSLNPLKKFFPKIRNGFVGVATPYYVENGIKYLQGKNIKDGKIDPTGLIHISEEFHLKKNNSRLRINDILMVQSGHVGECAVVEKEYDNANCHALIVLSPHDVPQINSHFVKDYFYTPIGKKIINQVKTGNTIEHVLASEVKEISISFPSKEEQTKIASFLSSVDQKISQLTQKHELLSQYKQGMMQKLFSQQIRFKADDGSEFGEWKTKKLEDIFSFSRGEPFSKTDISENGEFLCIHYGELFTKYKEVITNISSKTSLLAKNLGEIGDILMPSSDVTPDGLAKASCLNVSNVFLGGDINILRPQIPCSSEFFSYLINFEKQKVLLCVTGTTVKHVYNKDLKKIGYIYPCLEEQTKIANFLSAIDQKIEGVAQQIEQAKTWKKGLLQQMFV